MLTRAGFELAPSGYQSAALPVELSNSQGPEVSFYPSARDILATTQRLSNPARMKTFQLTSAVSDYRENVLFIQYKYRHFIFKLIPSAVVLRRSAYAYISSLLNIAFLSYLPGLNATV